MPQTIVFPTSLASQNRARFASQRGWRLIVPMIALLVLAPLNIALAAPVNDRAGAPIAAVCAGGDLMR